MKRIAAIIVVLLAAGGLWFYLRPPKPPETPAARVERGNLVQVLTTNGKVEALDSFEVHTRAPVLVKRVLVQEGDHVRRGQLLADVDTTVAREALAHAQAQLEVARADRRLIERGGSAAELAELETAIARARLEKETAEREIASLQRLVERGAAPRADLQDQRHRLIKTEAELAALERKRTAFIGPEDRERVLARIRESETAVAQVQTTLRDTEIRSPADGTVYFLVLRPGGFYEAGTLVARVGRLAKVRVRLLVDEPELGPVEVGQPVRITWDALPGVSWEGHVERLPSMVQTVGARTVGEVLCTIETPMRRLLPNVTVNVEIRTGVAENVLIIPREAVVRQGEQTVVLVVDQNDTIVRRPVQLGIHDMGRIEVKVGLSENQIVALPGERIFSPGQTVRPKITR